MSRYYLNPLATNPAADYSKINTDHSWAFNNILSGWSECVNPADGSLDTLSYASANSIVITGADRTSAYVPGTKLKINQTTDKYFIVVLSVYGGGNTTIYVDGRGVYSVANAAISSPYFSRAFQPQGFPDWILKPDGWQMAFETWTYASASTFTISGDLTVDYQRGDKIKLTQTTIKYFDISDIAYNGGTGLTTVTVDGHGIYTLANATITDNFYSKEQTPQGFPMWNDGWKVSRETWTYASASTFIISGDYTSVYQPGDKIKFTQTTEKFFDVVSVSYSAPNTTVTVDGCGLYTIANATITKNYFSKEQRPKGYFFNTGWTPFLTTLSYASSTTFTISGDYTGILQKNDRIKLTQTSVKYFYVLSVLYSAPNTTVTVTGGSDYSVANAAITNACWSHECNPFGFPDQFNYTVTVTGFSADPAGMIGKFSIDNNRCFVDVAMPNNGTSNATTFTVGLPVAAKTLSSALWYCVLGLMVDNGTTLTVAGRGTIGSGATSITLRTDMSSGAWTNTGNKRASFNVSYPI